MLQSLQHCLARHTQTSIPSSIVHKQRQQRAEMPTVTAGVYLLMQLQQQRQLRGTFRCRRRARRGEAFCGALSVRPAQV